MSDLVIASEELITYLQHKDSDLDVVQDFDGNLVIDNVVSVDYFRFNMLDRNRDAFHFNYNSFKGSKLVLAAVIFDPDYGITDNFHRGKPRKFQLGNWKIIDRPVSDCSSTKPTEKPFESLTTSTIPETKAEHLIDSHDTSEYNPMDLSHDEPNSEGLSHDYLNALINGPRGSALINLALLGFMKDIKTQLDKMETDIADIKTHLVEASNK